MMILVLSGVGTLTLTILTLRVALFIRRFQKPSALSRYIKDNEAWALVTGGSDGIGLGFVHELARQGLNVTIHGRNAAKLADVRAEVERLYPERKFQTLVLDASKASPEQVQSLHFENLTVLVNNVGAGNGDRLFLRFMDRSLEEAADILAVNATFMVLLTRQLLPQLHRPGLIINVGSVLDSWPSAYIAPYSGAKGLIRTFSEALRTEMIMEGQDVEIMYLRVLSVATKSSGETASWVNVTPNAIARDALARVGSGVASTAGCFHHEVIIWLTELLPRQMLGLHVSKQVKAKIGAKHS